MMHEPYVIRAGKLVTVTERGTIHDAAMLVEEGKIRGITTWKEAAEFANELKVIDYSQQVLTPSLIDCHTHLLEYAPGAMYPVTQVTHGIGGQSLLLQALSSGITAIGEQICGYHKYNLAMSDIRNWADQVPMDVSFSSSTISVGFRQMAHFSAATQSLPIDKKQLLDEQILQYLIEHSEYPGENLFINATPANFSEEAVPTAGEVIYSQQELNKIVNLFHMGGRLIGAHVGGEQAIRMALDAGIDVLHHAHGITRPLVEQAARQHVSIVATPIGGTHLTPNSPEDILRMMAYDITVAISTDAYLPPHPEAAWIPPECAGKLLGPESLLLTAQPAMKLLYESGWDENAILALITRNPAKIMGKADTYGQLRTGLEANFVIATGVPGLEFIDPTGIRQVYYRGVKVIDRG